MSGVRDRAVRAIDDVLDEVYLGHITVAEGEKQILSIREIAVVNRDAALPIALRGVSKYDEGSRRLVRADEMLRGWVEEVKE